MLAGFRGVPRRNPYRTLLRCLGFSAYGTAPHERLRSSGNVCTRSKTLPKRAPARSAHLTPTWRDIVTNTPDMVEKGLEKGKELLASVAQTLESTYETVSSKLHSESKPTSHETSTISPAVKAKSGSRTRQHRTRKTTAKTRKARAAAARPHATLSRTRHARPKPARPKSR